ncbi:MAG: hypothetical protein B6247_17615 [Candidatus Parabeggiatoa sp. nov. 2]|nr:MAG: hypothetical protein B6247_17615 [Beggiatoa sp. 4572_84]
MLQRSILLIKTIDILSITLSGIIAYIAYLGLEEWPMPFYHSMAIVLSALLSLIIFPWFGVHKLDKYGLFSSVHKLIIAWITVTTVMILFGFGLKISTDYSRVWIAIWVVLGAVMLVVMRSFVYRSIYYINNQGWHLNKIVIIGAQQLGQMLVRNIKASEPYISVEVVSFFDDDKKLQGKTVENIPVNNNISTLPTFVEKNEINEVWVTPQCIEQSRLKTILVQLRHNLVTVRFVANLFSFRMINASITNRYGLPVITLTESPMIKKRNRLLKAIEDRVLATLIQESGPVWAKKEENRATRFGTFIRKSSLDELPQFWNVLKGEMSIVGPRPERPHFVEQFKHEIPDYMQKHLVKAGITGWAQINGWRGNTDLRPRIEHDIYYIENWSVWFDIQIIVTTIFKGFFDKNAY